MQLDKKMLDALGEMARLIKLSQNPDQNGPNFSHTLINYNLMMLNTHMYNMNVLLTKLVQSVAGGVKDGGELVPGLLQFSQVQADALTEMLSTLYGEEGADFGDEVPEGRETPAFIVSTSDAEQD